MNTTTKKLSIFIFPYLAKGHLTIMVDIACLLARSHRNVEPTIVVNPANVPYISSKINRSLGPSCDRVQLLTYPLSSRAQIVGGGSTTESSMMEKNFHLTEPAHEELLNKHKPDAILVDTNFWWIPTIAAKLEIPYLFSLPCGSFSCVVLEKIGEILRNDVGLVDVVQVPFIRAPMLHIPVSEMPEFMIPKDGSLSENIEKHMQGSFGFIPNTYYDLEPEYCEEFKASHKGRAYFIGPIALANKKHGDHLDVESDRDVACLKWLDAKEDGSVVYVSFGSQSYFEVDQLQELAFGLENSGKNFLWIVRGVIDSPNQVWTPPQGWEVRVAGRGLLVQEWILQEVILAHRAIGAFLTHCGWNSILEGSTAGIPLLTWALDNEQFINERFVVDVAGCGARVCSGGKRSLAKEGRDLVPKEIIAEAVSKFMENGGHREREKAQELATKAKNAVAEEGKSTKDLIRLIDDLMEAKISKQ